MYRISRMEFYLVGTQYCEKNPSPCREYLEKAIVTSYLPCLTKSKLRVQSMKLMIPLYKFYSEYAVFYPTKTTPLTLFLTYYLYFSAIKLFL